MGGMWILYVPSARGACWLTLLRKKYSAVCGRVLVPSASRISYRQLSPKGMTRESGVGASWVNV